LENERKTADAAYAAALTVIDSTISRAQTYSERMTGMKANQFTDAGLKIDAQPPNLCGELRDYQLEGYRWLVRRAFAGESIILADEMGLGASLLFQRGRPREPLFTPPSPPFPPPPPGSRARAAPSQAKPFKSSPTCAGSAPTWTPRAPAAR